MERLTGLDAGFLYMETPTLHMHTLKISVLDPSTVPGGYTFERVKEVLGERIHLLPPFRRRLAEVPLGLHHPVWIEDPDFDLDFHIRESAVPPPGDDRRVAETVARIFARPLDRTRPLWELYLIHGLEGGRVALLTKVHHSVVDGVSGNEILAVLLDPSPEGRELPPRALLFLALAAAVTLLVLGRGLAGLPRQPLRALRAAPSALPNLTEIPGANAFPGVPRLSRGVASVRRRLGLEPFAVLGHSWGGVLAMEYATRHPERTSHLVLVNTAPASGADSIAFRQHLRRIRPARDIERMDALRASPRYAAGDVEAEADYYRIHYRPALRDPERLEQVIGRLRVHFTAETVLVARAIEERLYDQTWRSAGYDLVPKLERLDIPTLVVHGEDDFVPVALAGRIADAMRRAQLVVLPDCGHFAYLEHPDALHLHVRELLGSS